MTAVYELPLQPQRGDGRLTCDDVRYALEDLPRGDGEVLVRLDECDDFEPGAPELLARELSGCAVRHQIGARAWRVGAHWAALYERESAAYLAVEARLLGRGA